MPRALVEVSPPRSGPRRRNAPIGQRTGGRLPRTGGGQPGGQSLSRDREVPLRPAIRSGSPRPAGRQPASPGRIDGPAAPDPRIRMRSTLALKALPPAMPPAMRAARIQDPLRRERRRPPLRGNPDRRTSEGPEDGIGRPASPPRSGATVPVPRPSDRAEAGRLAPAACPMPIRPGHPSPPPSRRIAAAHTTLPGATCFRVGRRGCLWRSGRTHRRPPGAVVAGGGLPAPVPGRNLSR